MDVWFSEGLHKNKTNKDENNLNVNSDYTFRQWERNVKGKRTKKSTGTSRKVRYRRRKIITFVKKRINRGEKTKGINYKSRKSKNDRIGLI